MTVAAQERWLRRSAVLALVALALIVWSLVVPEPVPVIVSMTLGQVVGTASFGIYLVIVAADLGLVRRLRRSAEPPPSAEVASEIPETTKESAKTAESEEPSETRTEAPGSTPSESAGSDARSEASESAESDAESERAGTEDDS